MATDNARASVHVALDDYANWKFEKDRGWRDDWKPAVVKRAALIAVIKRELPDRALAELQGGHVEAMQQALLARGVPIDFINAATSLLGDACRHVGVKSWVVHSLSAPEDIAAARARLDQVHAEQLRERRALLDSVRSRVAHGPARFVALPGPTAVGGSRLGGAPDGPRDFQWPVVDGRPLAFLLQLDLAALGLSELPTRGRLLFFYDLDNNPWGTSPEDVGWAVIHDCTENPVPVPLPASYRAGFGPARIELYRGEAAFDTQHQILGVADPLQSPVMPLPKDAADWILLLQLDSDYPIDLVLGRGGRLYFWIRRQDLQRAHFEAVRVIFQTT